MIISEEYLSISAQGHVVMNPEQIVELFHVLIALVQSRQNINDGTIRGEYI